MNGKKLYQINAEEGNHTKRPVLLEKLYYRIIKAVRLKMPFAKVTFESYMERILEQVKRVVVP